MPDEIELCETADTEEKVIGAQLGKGIVGGFLFVMIMAIVSPLFYAKSGDTFGFLRTIFETAGPVAIKGTLGLILWCALEYGLKWCWTRKIYDAEYGPTIVFAVFWYCVLR